MSSASGSVWCVATICGEGLTDVLEAHGHAVQRPFELFRVPQVVIKSLSLLSSFREEDCSGTIDGVDNEASCQGGPGKPTKQERGVRGERAAARKREAVSVDPGL